MDGKSQAVEIYKKAYQLVLTGTQNLDHGAVKTAYRNFSRALPIVKKACAMLESTQDNEPLRSRMYYIASVCAFYCDLFVEAIDLATAGLVGYAPDEEIRSLLRVIKLSQAGLSNEE